MSLDHLGEASCACVYYEEPPLIEGRQCTWGAAWRLDTLQRGRKRVHQQEMHISAGRELLWDERLLKGGVMPPQPRTRRCQSR